MFACKGKSAVTDHSCSLSSEPYEGFDKKQNKKRQNDIHLKTKIPSKQHGRTMFIDHKHTVHLLTSC